MTDAELYEIEERASKAESGPWHIIRMETGDYEISNPRNPALFISTIWAHRQDAEFVAHARTDIPALIAEIRRLQREQE